MPSLQEMTTTPGPYYMKDFLASLPDGYQNGQFCALTIDVSYRQNVARIATSILEYVLYRKKSEQYPAIDTYGNQQVHQLGKHLDARTMSVNTVLDLMLSHGLRIIYNAPSAGFDLKWKGVVKNRGDLKVMQMGDFNMTGQEVVAVPLLIHVELSVNAFIIYKHTSTRRTKKWYTHKDFREELFKEMIAGYRQWKRNTMEGTLNQ
ncbi:LOW QUALITY PROTEIN: hypothetical protein MAR_019954 [Mya arenaria]|uniref:Uncharacterized protein n=1 Tax=Mya arenaria TaxID=6604 RepID=A0ABY7E6N4_MYAAR|nr:LOW QUALITY PROTEIN: hypothetical protein MAR_019954 [Mya arenaria]